MGNREVRMARTMILDAMLIGAVLSQEGDAGMILESIKPEDMSSASGRLMLETIIEKDRKRFAKLIARRYGVVIRDDERAMPAILRAMQLRKSAEVARGMSQVMLESVQQWDDLTDIAEQWEEGLSFLKRVVEVQRQMTNHTASEDGND